MGRLQDASLGRRNMRLLNVMLRKGGGHSGKTGYGTEGALVSGGFYASLDGIGRMDGEEFLRRWASL